LLLAGGKMRYTVARWRRPCLLQVLSIRPSGTPLSTPVTLEPHEGVFGQILDGVEATAAAAQQGSARAGSAKKLNNILLKAFGGR
jgi:hypothetical protein